MVIRFARNKTNQKVVEEQGFDEALASASRFLLSIWKFQQFARFSSTLVL